MYDLVGNSWTSYLLPRARYGSVLAGVRDLVLVVSGALTPLTPADGTDIVDVFHIPTHTWRERKLSQARTRVAAVTVADCVLVAGGALKAGTSDVVDVYNATTDSWLSSLMDPRKVQPLYVPRAFISGTSPGLAVFAGGAGNGSGVSDTVDLYGRACARDQDCTDGVFCNGQELCVRGVCMNGAPPCGHWDPCNSTCNEGAECVHILCFIVLQWFLWLCSTL